MTNQSLLLKNGTIIKTDKKIVGDILIHDGRIAMIKEGGFVKVPSDIEVLDATNMYIAPGMIETHCDAIEKEMEPRPNTFFPLEMAMNEMERKLAGNGITTIYHSVSLSDGTGSREDDNVIHLMNSIDYRRRYFPTMVRNRIHLRYEVTNNNGSNTLKDFIDQKKVDLLSFMDHSPGQGQFKSEDSYQKYLTSSYGIPKEDARERINEMLARKEKVNWGLLRELGRIANEKGICLASHDDDSIEKIDSVLKHLEIQISEFPITLEAAEYAIQKGLYVSVGAPNLIRGFSHSNNMRAIDAVEAGAAHIICSDYHPSALLPSVFKLHREGMALEQAVKMVSYYPAKALGIEDKRGSIEEGKQADLILVELEENLPRVKHTIVDGNVVYQSQLSLMT
ncbi:alpha-D-ribose 1-methylphosphonate 5-triphosphate diphosphatase [Alteribacillus sp. YIM 98480]|uniref:alpha-D-ribose 1-methylphosphonate 5-triphosphate diphosphatase n=1 Tax=Alteribacillus sp. YIM 98480 TaxID=2606599 RepID=UPI00131DDE80|nr:alpha-D-ribose 1-methylphosphonate 5-triphosphate diphosphatase [Alteribacillus sp. YIM 98480]